MRIDGIITSGEVSKLKKDETGASLYVNLPSLINKVPEKCELYGHLRGFLVEAKTKGVVSKFDLKISKEDAKIILDEVKGSDKYSKYLRKEAKAALKS